MKTTAAALRELQEHFDSLSPRPNVKELAKLAGMPYSTAARYLNGTTKQGLPDKVRALAHALGRDDIMEEVVTKTPAENPEAWWVFEVQRIAREQNVEELERERALRKESEARFDNIVRLLEQEKMSMQNMLLEALRRKKLYEKIITGMVVFLIFYLLVFDLPHPKYGMTTAIANLFR